MTNSADTDAFAHYFEHHQDGWPVVDGWNNDRGCWASWYLDTFKKPSDAPAHWHRRGYDLVGLSEEFLPPEPIDIQALTGLLVVELAKKYGCVLLYDTRELEWQIQDNECDRVASGELPLSTAVDAWMQIHGLPEASKA
ncbi:MAG: hypothetical protein AAGB48_08310 [Planctomycetota bacterium]